MALQDILAAITAAADKQIEQARTEHQAKLSTLRDDHTERVNDKKNDFAKKKDAKKKQLLMKTQSHSAAFKANAELTRKQKLIDEMYNETLQAAAKLSAADQAKILEACLAKLPSKGTIMPAKAHADVLKQLAKDHSIGETIDAVGGFIFASDTTEHNFTFEHLVQNVLRPATEITVANQLFI